MPTKPPNSVNSSNKLTIRAGLTNCHVLSAAPVSLVDAFQLNWGTRLLSHVGMLCSGLTVEFKSSTEE
ncbi:hypothetical protein N9L06_04875 [Mariniblastus sp.]|nr:hypothetical protein [Mariniblastus sp.]